MGLVRQGLFAFALVNAVAWAALAVAWRWRPQWAERLPLELGTHERYLKAAPAWARLAGALAGFWITAAALYMVSARSDTQAAIIALFTAAAAFLILGIGAAAAAYRATTQGGGPTPVAD